jgi:putative addiction module component (TIGR02574 family)
MVMSDVLAEALRLPADERERVARELLRSVDAERGGASYEPDFEAELERRMAEAQRDPSAMISHEDFLATLDARRAARASR